MKPGPDKFSDAIKSPLEDQTRPGARRRWVPIAVWPVVLIGLGLVWRAYSAPSPDATSTTGAASTPGPTSAPPPEVAPTPPAIRDFGEIAFVPDLEGVVLTGGVRFLGVGGFEPVEGTWLLDAESRSWSRLTLDKEMPARLGHSMAVANSTLVVFGGAFANTLEACSVGGWCFTQLLGDTWTLDPGERAWEFADSQAGPTARYGAAMEFDPGSGRVILFGGTGASSELHDDTWAFDPVTRQWEELFPTFSPPPRAWHRMIIDRVTSRLLILGGVGPDSAFTWAFDPVAGDWQQLEENPLGSRWGIAVGLDSETGLIYAVGGEHEQVRTLPSGTVREQVVSDEVWVREAGFWRQLEPFPAPIIGSAAFDTTTSHLVVYVITSFRGTLFALLDTMTLGAWEAYDPTH